MSGVGEFVVVVVTPQLFGDVLASALRAHHVPVIGEAAALAVGGRVAVAVLTRGLLTAVPHHTSVHLPPDGDLISVATSHGAVPTVVRDLEALARLVTDLVRRSI